MIDFRQMFTGPMIRSLAKIKDVGEIILANVQDPDGGEVTTIADDKSDIYVKVMDAMTQLPIIGKLFVPANILFRLPLVNDAVLALRGANAHGPGVPYIAHGDCGAQNQVPPWLDKNNSGVYLPEGFHLESTGDQVVITSNSGGTPASVTLSKQGGIALSTNSGQDGVTLDGAGNYSVKAGGVTVIQGSASSLALGLVGALPVLVQGTIDSLGVPVTQNPAASATIVKAG